MGKCDCERELSLLRKAANTGVSSPTHTQPQSLLPAQTTGTLTTTVTVMRISVSPTGWELNVFSVQRHTLTTPGDKQCGPLCGVSGGNSEC